MLDVGGQDSTEAFEDVGHSDEAREILEGLLVGTIKRGVSSSLHTSQNTKRSQANIPQPGQRPSRQSPADHFLADQHRQRRPGRHGRRPLRRHPDRWRPGLLRLPVHAAEPAEGIEEIKFPGPASQKKKIKTPIRMQSRA